MGPSKALRALSAPTILTLDSMSRDNQNRIRIMLIIFGMASLMFWCFMAFIGHGWVQAPVNIALIDAALFIAAPLMGMFAWRGSKVASIMLYVAVVLVLWLPPWVIMPMSFMALITVLMIILGSYLRYIESRIQQGTPGDAKTARLS